MIKRLLFLSALAAPLAACGPDCSGFCTKLVSCAVISSDKRGECITGCDEVGGDRAAYISCVNDPNHSCADIQDGVHCALPGLP